MKYLFIFIITLSIFGCDTQPPETAITQFQQSVETKDLSKLENLYMDDFYRCSLDQVNFPEKLHDLNFKIKAMTAEDIERYKTINRSEATKVIEFANFLKTGLNYKDAGEETYKYLNSESNPRQGIKFKTIPSHEAEITLMFTQSSADILCPQRTHKRMTLYLAQKSGQYKIIDPMCDVQLATTDATKIIEETDHQYIKNIDLNALKEAYKAEDLTGIKTYSKDSGIPQSLVYDAFKTSICPSF